MPFKLTEKLTASIYLLVPMACILLWAFVAIAKDDFSLTTRAGAIDLDPFYHAAKYIFTEPEKIYDLMPQPYPYTPFFAIIFWPMGFLTFEQAHWYYYSALIILAELTIITFNQILILKKVSNNFHRFLFLIAISNGLVYMNTFDILTGSMLPSFALILFLKREIQYRELNKDITKIKFIFTQMMLLMLAIGIFIQFSFFVLIYLFHNISKIKEIINKSQLKRYFLLILSFIIQNFMLIVIIIRDPVAISNFLGGYWRGYRSLPSKSEYEYSYILKYRLEFSCDGISSVYYALSLYFDFSSIDINLFLISITIMSIITIIIILQKNFTIEKKFGWWALFSLFFYTFIYMRYFVGLLPIITLLFTDYYVKENNNIIEFIKKNYFILIGVICIAALYFMPPIHYLIRVLPFLWNVPIVILLLRWFFIYIVILIDLILLAKKNSKNLTINQRN